MTRAFALGPFPCARRAFRLAAVLALGAAAAGAAERALDVIVPDSWIPGVPVLVRVEVRGADGAVDRTLWDVEAVLSAAPAGTTLAPDRVTLRNGLGSALVRIETPPDTAEIVLDTAIGALEAARTLQNLAGRPRIETQGVLPAALVEWSGIVRVTGALTVPAGGTLRVLPGTLVLIDGASADGAGHSISVAGAIECLGTPAQPVTFTARDPALPWGEVRHDGARPSLYRCTIMTRGGNSPRGGHTNTGPILRATNSRVRCERCAFTDAKGKSMQASGADLEFYDCLFSRAAMGPEIDGTALLWERCWALDFHGKDDNDGIYLHRQRAGQTIALRGCVVASGDDDAVDTLGAEVLIEDCILRDFANPAEDSKGLSVLEGAVDVRRTLIVNCKVGVSAKIRRAGNQAIVRIDRSTILGNEVAVQAYDKYGVAEADIFYYASNSILRAADAIYTDYRPEDLRVSYCDVSEEWPGAGNIAADPLFVDPAAGDFTLRADSPCIDAGDPAAPPDPDGSRADMGCFPFTRADPPPPRFICGAVKGRAAVDLSDAVALLLHLFAGRPIPCAKAADANDSGTLDIADAARLLDYLFAGGPALPAPAGACGTDPTEDPLDCRVSPCP